MKNRDSDYLNNDLCWILLGLS